jgi:steroid delta-isomerase-like uncharacterized protein
MTDEELIARAHDLIAAWNQRDIDRIVSAFSADVRFRDAGSASNLGGREAVRADAEALLGVYDDIELEVSRTVADGNVVTQEFIARGTEREGEAGRVVERRAVTVADYDSAGRIASYARYWDGGPLSA